MTWSIGCPLTTTAPRHGVPMANSRAMLSPTTTTSPPTSVAERLPPRSVRTLAFKISVCGLHRQGDHVQARELAARPRQAGRGGRSGERRRTPRARWRLACLLT